MVLKKLPKCHTELFPRYQRNLLPTQLHRNMPVPPQPISARPYSDTWAHPTIKLIVMNCW